MHRTLPALLLASVIPVACAGRARDAAYAAPAPDLALELRLVAGAAGPVAVDLAFAFPGDTDGDTVIELAEAWGGVGPERRDLEDLRVEAGGRELALEALGPHRWRVAHAPGARLVVRARLPRNAASLRTDAAGREHYRPILEPGLFHGIGHLLLPVPDHLAWDRERAIELLYPGFADAGWEVADSFGTGSGPRRCDASLGELRSALFLAGALELFRPERCPGLVVAVARPGRTGFAFDGAELAELTGRIVALERELMGDTRSDHYLVSAIPVGDPEQRGHSFGGTGLTDCFALFLQPNLPPTAEGPSGLELRRLLAHECFHEWNGIGIPLAQPEEAGYWFSEGFTNWAAREVLRRGDWLDDAAYAADLSLTLRAYHTSAARNRTAEELAPAFWTDPAAQRQPYLRGDVVAMVLDHALRDASGGADDLFGFLRDLLDEARADGTRFDSEALLARIEARVGASAGAEHGREVAAAVRRVVVHGATAELPAGAFEPAFAVGAETVHAWDPGLDVDASIAARRAIGVRPDGPAARAGLVEGREVRGLSVWRDDADREIELVTWDGQREERLEFLPRGAKVTVPVVRVAESR